MSILLFWLILWQLAAMLIHNAILLVGPLEVLSSLASQIQTFDFWKTLFLSSGRICSGFLLAFCTGILLGSLAYKSTFFKELFAPIMLLTKSIPVASFVILALIWMGSQNLSIFISFLVVLPMVYNSTLAGLENTDIKLLEMAFVFRMPFFKRIKGIYLPSLSPYLENSINTALGMSIKSGVAAEVIGVPDFSIGEKLYTSKIYLDTADLFAWTLIIILITFLFERFFLFLLGLFTVKRTNKPFGKETLP